MESASHEGSLKRICGPALSLLKSLVTSDILISTNNVNIFYERFVSLPQQEIMKINFSKHIVPTKNMVSKVPKEVVNQQRQDAVELLGLLVYSRQNTLGDVEPFDVDALVNNNDRCKERLRLWMKRFEADRVIIYIHTV